MSRKIRVNLSLEPEMVELFDELARLQGKPRSTVISDYLLELRPHLEDIKQVFLLLEQQKDPKQILNRIYINSQQSVLDRLKDINDD